MADHSESPAVGHGEPHRKAENPRESWESAATVITSGTDDAYAASWYLTRSRIWPLISIGPFGPLALGVVLFLLIVAMVLFSPSTDSHFIYTDF